MVSLLLVTMLAGPAFASDASAHPSDNVRTVEGGDPKTAPNPDPDPNPTPNPDPKSDPNPDPNPDPKPDPDPNPNPDPKPDPDPDPKPDPDPDPNPDPKPDPDPDPNPDPKPPVEDCPHEWVEVTIPSTCAEPGGTCKVCAKCESIVVTEVFPLAAHTYDSACDPDCNVCGAVREASHKPAAGWDYNSSKHWHVCAVCGTSVGEADHYPGPAATEDKDQICLTCGKIMMTKRSHTHKKESDWSFDGTGHWHACKGCQEKLDFEPHNLTGSCGSPCSKCGYVSEDGHLYGDSWYFSADEHWQICTVCGAEDVRSAHTPDPETGICTICAADSNTEPTEDHEHDFGDVWLNDSDGHWQICDCGEETSHSAHAWKVSGPDKDGVITFLCNTCGFEKTEMTETTEKAPSGFPFGIIFAILGAIIVGLVVALLFVLGVFKKPGSKKNGRFSK